MLIPGHTTFASKKGLYGVWPGIGNRIPAITSGRLLIIILETDPRAQAREAGGGWAHRPRAEKKIKQLTSEQASCTMGIYKKGNMDTTQLKRIADAIEEILRLVKKDMEDANKRSK